MVATTRPKGNQTENVDNMMDSAVKENENLCAVEENFELQNPDKKQATDECNGNLEVCCEITASDEMQG